MSTFILPGAAVEHGRGRFYLSPALCGEPIDHCLQRFHKLPDVVSVAYGVMHLDGKGDQTLCAILEVSSQCEHRKEVLSIVENVDVEGGECEPGDHGNIKGVWRPVRFWGVSHGG